MVRVSTTDGSKRVTRVLALRVRTETEATARVGLSHPARRRRSCNDQHGRVM